jgi:hypothetical protein
VPHGRVALTWRTCPNEIVGAEIEFQNFQRVGLDERIADIPPLPHQVDAIDTSEPGLLQTARGPAGTTETIEGTQTAHSPTATARTRSRETIRIGIFYPSIASISGHASSGDVSNSKVPWSDFVAAPGAAVFMFLTA